MRRVLTSGCGVLAALVLAAAPGPATAASGPPDPDAPAGASGQWLPDEPWVMQRWTPFDETRLYDLLHTTRPGLERWLADSRGRRTIVELARRRGVGRARLVRYLVAPERDRVSARDYRLLRARTNRVVTQSHLAQHMLFHTFHTWAVRDAARRTLGISASEWRHLRDRPRGSGPGVTVADLARRRHIAVKRLRRPVIRAITKATRRGVHLRATPHAQAAAELAEQRWKIAYWPLDRGRDEANDAAAGAASGAAERSASADPYAHLYCAL